MDKYVSMCGEKVPLGSVQMGEQLPNIIQKSADSICIKTRMIPLSFCKEARTVMTMRTRHDSIRQEQSADIPAHLYHFSTLGLLATLYRYGYGEHDLTITTEMGNSPWFEYFEFKDGVVVKVHKSIITDVYKLKVLFSVAYVMGLGPMSDIDELFDPSNEYYKYCLGKCITPTATNRKIFVQNANDHLTTCFAMVDDGTKDAFKSIGIEVNDLHDLIQIASYNLP